MAQTEDVITKLKSNKWNRIAMNVQSYLIARKYDIDSTILKHVNELRFFRKINEVKLQGIIGTTTNVMSTYIK
jgi:hypothetical protein